ISYINTAYFALNTTWQSAILTAIRITAWTQPHPSRRRRPGPTPNRMRSMFACHRNLGLAPMRGEHAPAYPRSLHLTGGCAALLALTLAALALGLGPAIAAANTVEKQVATSTDDAEEFSAGSMYLNSTTLQMVLYSGGNQTVGMRWTSLAIPPGSTITAAYIQFTAKEAQSDSTYLYIRGQAGDNPATFATGSLNISSRPRTTATATWQPASWPTVGAATAAQRTPDLTAGTYTATLTVTDVGSDVSPATTSFVVRTDTAPVARLTLSQLATPALTVKADASTSTDTDFAPIASYQFTFGDGTAAVTTTAPT